MEKDTWEGSPLVKKEASESCCYKNRGFFMLAGALLMVAIVIACVIMTITVAAIVKSDVRRNHQQIMELKQRHNNTKYHLHTIYDHIPSMKTYLEDLVALVEEIQADVQYTSFRLANVTEDVDKNKMDILQNDNQLRYNAEKNELIEDELKALDEKVNTNSVATRPGVSAVLTVSWGLFLQQILSK